MAYLLGCDVGTGGAKAVIVDEQGHVLGSHFVEYPLSTPRPGIAEQDPELFWQAAAETMRVAIERAGVNLADIAGVCVSAQSPGCVLIDKDRRVLRPVHIWMDRRATEQCRWLREHVGASRVLALTGIDVIDPYFGLTKIMWERDNEPGLYRRAIKNLNQKDFVVMRMTGEILTDRTNASLMGIAYDARRKDWDRDMLKDIGVDRSKLPDVRSCDEVIGKINREFAAHSGLIEGTPVVNGAVDGPAAWLSMGAIDEGDSVLTLGSSAIWAVAHHELLSTPGLLVLENIADPATYITAAATSSAGALLRWFRDEFGAQEAASAATRGVNPYDLLTAQAEPVPVGSDGLIILPYFMGERMPIWDCSARGVMFGLSLNHTRGHVIRALMEAVAFSVHHNVKLARDRGLKIREPMAMVEGGAKSPVWRQMISDVCGIDTAFMDGAQGAPFGDAVMAGAALGVFSSYRVVKSWLRCSHYTRPDPDKHARYQQLFGAYLDLYESLKPNFAALEQLYRPQGSCEPGLPYAATAPAPKKTPEVLKTSEV